MKSAVSAISTTAILLLFCTSVHAGQAGIEVLSWFCTEEGSELVVRGEIRNQSQVPVTPTVIALFRSIKGVMLAHAKGVPVFSPLPGGQSSPIELRSLGRHDIANCELSLQDALTGNLYFSATQELPYELQDGMGDARRGKSIFNGKGICNACHGYLGQIDQIPDSTATRIPKMNPKPTNLKSPKNLRLTTDKQRFRAIKYGIPGTAMVPMEHISEDEIIDALAYLRILREESIMEEHLK